MLVMETEGTFITMLLKQLCVPARLTFLITTIEVSFYRQKRKLKEWCIPQKLGCDLYFPNKFTYKI